MGTPPFSIAMLMEAHQEGVVVALAQLHTMTIRRMMKEKMVKKMKKMKMMIVLWVVAQSPALPSLEKLLCFFRGHAHDGLACVCRCWC